MIFHAHVKTIYDMGKIRKGSKFNWAAIGAIVLILLLLAWFAIVDSDGNPDNGLITPLCNQF